MIYYNPPKELKEVGRKLSGSRKHEVLLSQLGPDEVVFGLYDRGVFFNAPELTEKKQFEEFESQYDRGSFLSREFYAIKKDLYQKIRKANGYKD